MNRNLVRLPNQLTSVTSAENKTIKGTLARLRLFKSMPCVAEALLRMAAPGAGFRGGTFFEPKIGEDQKKKKRALPKNQWTFSPNENGDNQTK